MQQGLNILLRNNWSYHTDIKQDVLDSMEDLTYRISNKDNPNERDIEVLKELFSVDNYDAFIEYLIQSDGELDLDYIVIWIE